MERTKNTSENLILQIGILYGVMFVFEVAEGTVENFLFFSSFNQQCSIYARSYLIAYAAVKLFFFVIRGFCLWFAIKERNFAGAIFMVGSFIFWIVGMLSFYIAEANKFFKKENDCKEKASDLYYGMLFIFIEGCVTVALVTIYSICSSIAVGLWIWFEP